MAALLALGAAAEGTARREVALVRNGTPQATLFISAAQESDTDAALHRSLRTDVASTAQECVRWVEAMSGARLPIRRISEAELPAALEETRKAGGHAILLGALAKGHLAPPEGGWGDSSAFRISVREGVVAIAGPTPRATEIGLYAALEQLGLRWYFPGELGTVIPCRADVALAEQETLERPGFRARNFQLRSPDGWVRRQRAGGAYFPGAHGIPLGEDATFQTHPELFALVKGERNPKQLCLSNPEVLRRAAEQTRAYFRKNPGSPWFGLGPEDGGGFCECAGCQALDAGDFDPFSSTRSVTDRYIWFFNQVLKAIEGEYPDKKLAFYIYHAYMRPPVREKPDPRIAAALAPIALCRLHGVGNPVCPERSYLKTLLEAWSPILPDLYERGYWFNLADPAMPFVQISRLKAEIPYYAGQGIQGFRTECLNHWALQGPSLYLAGRLMWNPKADADAIVKEYCENLYGPAAEEMLAYYLFADERVATGDHHTGSSFAIRHFFPTPARETMRGHLRRAQALATESPYRERLELATTGFAYSDAFARMLEARDRQEWPAALAALKEVDVLRAKLVAHEPPLLEPGSSEGHFRRFFRLAVEQGAARTSGGNHLVTPLAEEWDFLVDPSDVGMSLRYFSPGTSGGNWQKVRPLEQSWSDLGLRYYRGLSWYRQRVNLPAEAVGKRLFLWFGGVDETARIWVNGTLIGTSPTSAFTPFEVDATEAVREGENEVVLCIANHKTDELGTGGITAPAFFYSPAKGAAAELENLKPLRDTFP